MAAVDAPETAQAVRSNRIGANKRIICSRTGVTPVSFLHSPLLHKGTILSEIIPDTAAVKSAHRAEEWLLCLRQSG